MARHITAVVLAAGEATRFGGQKLLASISGRPVLQHVLDTVAGAGIRDVVVVLGSGGDEVGSAIEWRSERRVRNPDPSRGLASSLRIGLEAVPASADGALVVLGDQPALTSTTIEALLARGATSARPIVVPRYSADAGRNPVLVARSAFAIVREASGDRGLGPLLERMGEEVEEVPIEGANPDVDTPGDLARAAAERWAARVRADREQVDRLRRVPVGADFYAPVRSIFRADPTRTGDEVLDALRARVQPDDVVLDIGAGAGRYALPLAGAAREVIAFDASTSMLETLAEDARAFGIANVRVVHGRWPEDAAMLGSAPAADIAVMAHIGYDVEAIVPFIEAAEVAVRRACIAVLMEAQPGSVAAPLWPAVHGEERVILPGLNEFVELLMLRGATVTVDRVPRDRRRFADRAELEGLLRRQLWIEQGGEHDRRMREAMAELVVEDEDGIMLGSDELDAVGIVLWEPGSPA